MGALLYELGLNNPLSFDENPGDFGRWRFVVFNLSWNIFGKAGIFFFLLLDVSPHRREISMCI